MNLYEILGFQPKGVATLSFSSRKRPAYAGMTGRVPVMLALRQYPQSEATTMQTNRRVRPSCWLQGSIHRAGCDAGEQDKTTPDRHSRESTHLY